MQENRNRSIQHLFKAEGYLSNAKHDSGGLTCFGVSSKYYPDVVKQLMALPMEDAQKVATDFYIKNFWDPLSCDTLSAPLDSYAFIQGVNMGVSPVKAMLEGCSDGDDFLQRCQNRYDAIIEAHPEDEVFRKGWSNRLAGIKAVFGGAV